jgi:Family of unknown function (DUF6058)
MTLDEYLGRYYLNKQQFADACSMDELTLDELIANQLIAAPSYEVKDSKIRSYILGELPAPEATEGQYFHSDMVIWATRVDVLRPRFHENFLAALAQLDRSVWRLKDCFADDGSLIPDGYAARFAYTWDHFLHGTYGVCVAHPTAELAIARKEVLQEKLTALTENGTRTDYLASELPELQQTLDDYDRAAMPFSPVDYPLSSRKRLIDDVRNSLGYRASCSAEARSPSRIESNT